MSGARRGATTPRAAHESQRVLRPGGRLLLNLAAFEFLKGAHDYATDVERRYTRKKVRALLEGAGLQIERLTHWNAALMPPIALVRWLSRTRLARAPENARSDFRPLPSFANEILKRVATLELTRQPSPIVTFWHFALCHRPKTWMISRRT